MPAESEKIRRDEIGDSGIILGILQAIDNGEPVTQRTVASELGIALGLVNAYLRRCVKKGLVKMQTAPAHRYAYYLTPKGFAEKSKLTASYLTHSFSFFRTARADCTAVLADAASRGAQQVALVAATELAEIMKLCASDHGISIIGIVDASAKSPVYVGMPVYPDFESVRAADFLVITDIASPQTAYRNAAAAFGEGRVLAPALLRVRHRTSKPAKSETTRSMQ